ncbi:phosphogluconate dehydrogenase (NAD(+)-dependent, decarboxylating) [Oleidesulfovibrio sp.]|uniref:phosphogluconate dehydrogenase (NAD(+)-dependent, decarboxylating) n=1 Tax=Oleidesulfovibrio sp. TaxID=2909707 RepID=UPI003A8A4C77
MQIAIIGLGRMGMNMARRLLNGGHDVVVWNRSKDKVEQMQAEGATGFTDLADLATHMSTPRALWFMLPAGDATTERIAEVLPHLDRGDLIIDGANAYWRDDAPKAEMLAQHGIHYMDAGVSGGIWGLEKGYCTMVGGNAEDVARVAPALDTLAPPDGWLHCGPVGTGHFVKMVHNGIEYAMMEAYGEGFDLMRNGPFENLDLQAIAALWNRGSVVRSWLLELLDSALQKDADLSSLKGYVEDSGEGRWTVLDSVHHAVPVPVLAQALFRRFESRQDDLFSNKVLAALRNEFGGHAIKAAGDGSEGRK